MSFKRKPVEEHENHERWLVSYADFITLLFAFFVVMYATSNSDLTKQKKFESSLKESMKLDSPTNHSRINVSVGVAQTSKMGGVPISESLAANQAVPQTDLEDFVDTFFNSNEPRIQSLKSKIKISSDSRGVSIDVARQDVIQTQNPTALKIFGFLFKKADAQIQIISEIPKGEQKNYAQQVFTLREQLLQISGLQEQRVLITFLENPAKSIDTSSIRFTIIR